MNKVEKKDFIAEAFKKDGITDSYPKTLATFTRNKVKLKTVAAVGDVVLLVTKKGHENTSSHVGKVTHVDEKEFTFEMNLNNVVKTITLPFASMLAKEGLSTVGFYTIGK